MLAVGTASAGFNAARLWWLASSDPLSPDYRGNETIISMAMRHGVEKDAAARNRGAAKWTAYAAALGAVSALWETLAPLILC